MYSLQNTFAEFFLAGFNLEHCQVFWQLRWVYSQAMKRVYAGCSPRVKSISNDRTVRRHDVGEQSVKPKVLSRVFPVFPKHNHGITEGRDDNPIGPRHHEPWWHPRPNCAFCCTRIVPDKCSEVNIHVKSVLQALHHAQCCVCPDPAVLVEEEHSYHVTLCLNAHQEFFAITLKTSVRHFANPAVSCWMLGWLLCATRGKSSALAGHFSHLDPTVSRSDGAPLVFVVACGSTSLKEGKIRQKQPN